MESGLFVPEKQRSHGRDRNSDFSKIEIVEYSEEYFARAVAILWEAWFIVNEEDLDSMDTVFVPGQGDHKFLRAEALFDYFVMSGHKIFLALDDKNVCGILIGIVAFPSVVCVRLMYADATCRDKGIGKRFIDACKGVKKVIFQTRKAKEPKLLLENTKKYRRLISEDEKFYTWEMNWE